MRFYVPKPQFDFSSTFKVVDPCCGVLTGGKTPLSFPSTKNLVPLNQSRTPDMKCWGERAWLRGTRTPNCLARMLGSPILRIFLNEISRIGVCSANLESKMKKPEKDSYLKNVKYEVFRKSFLTRFFHFRFEVCAANSNPRNLDKKNPEDWNSTRSGWAMHLMNFGWGERYGVRNLKMLRGTSTGWGERYIFGCGERVFCVAGNGIFWLRGTG